MLNPLAVFATLCIAVAIGAQNVRAETSQPALEHQFDESEPLPSLFPPLPDKVRPTEIRATNAGLSELAQWLSTNFGLPHAVEPPRIERVTQLRLYQLRHRAFLSTSMAPNAGQSAVLPGYQREVVAVYEDSTQTIYLAETWTGASVAEQSVLVHEMVHHLQNIAGMKFACGGEREKPAYFAQSDWLRLHGLELEKEFDVDMFTIIALSTCMG
jgi:hypothetical protein